MVALRAMSLKRDELREVYTAAARMTPGFSSIRLPAQDIMPYLASLTQRARALKSDALGLYFAARHPGTPWYAKLAAFLIVAYTFSPVDLIPDFIPVLGYLDEVILIPVLIALTLKLVPDAVMVECRER